MQICQFTLAGWHQTGTSCQREAFSSKQWPFSTLYPPIPSPSLTPTLYIHSHIHTEPDIHTHTQPKWKNTWCCVLVTHEQEEKSWRNSLPDAVGEKVIKAWGRGKVVRDVYVLHPPRADTLRERSCCVSSQQETDKWRKVNYLKWRSLKRTSNWPPSAPYFSYLFGQTWLSIHHTLERSSPFNAHLDGLPGSSGRQNRVLHTVRTCNISHKTSLDFALLFCQSSLFPFLNLFFSFDAKKSTNIFFSAIVIFTWEMFQGTVPFTDGFLRAKQQSEKQKRMTVYKAVKVLGDQTDEREPKEKQWELSYTQKLTHT